ncbi:hypothetical protein EIP86_002480 [Pleurotus ostreatoroseus]|nr:hypothetical protein EIP86_002480 [Pleurotus ostreatoroseus]
MDHNEQDNQGLMRQFQSFFGGILHHSHANAGPSQTQQSATAAVPSEPPPYTAVEDREMSPVDSATLASLASLASSLFIFNNRVQHASTSAPRPIVSLEPSEPILDDEHDDSLPSLQLVTETPDEQEDEDVEMSADADPLQPMESSTPSATPPSSSSDTNRPTSARNSRRARVDDEEDEDDLRESNRQRMHSPVPPGEDEHLDDHHFHPDMNAHRAGNPGAPIFSRLTYVVDLLPPGPGPLPPQAGAAPAFFPFVPPPPAPATNDENDSAPQDQTVPPAPGTGAEGQAPGGPADFYRFLNMLREQFGNIAGMPWGTFVGEEPDDPVRARKLLSGLEDVPAGLVKRMQNIGGDEKPVCAVCFDDLLDPDAGFHTTPKEQDSAPMEVESEAPSSASSSGASDEERAAEEALKHKVVVLPCSHVFHASCLLPWFTRPHRTTCPTCRFDIDPESLTLSPPRASRTRSRRPPTVPTPATQQGPEQAAPSAEPTGDAPVQPEGDTQGQPQDGPQPRVRARRSIRPGDIPFGLIIDVSVFPSPLPASQAGQVPTFPPPIFGGNPQNFPFFGPLPTNPGSNAAHNATTTPNPNPNPNPAPNGARRPFNPGMAGLGFMPAEFQFIFGGPLPHTAQQPPAGASANPQNPQPAPTTAPQPQAAGPTPPTPPRGPQIHIHGDPGASALLADLLGLGRFQPPPPAGSTAAEQQRREQQPLPSFQEFINMSIPPQGATPANPPPADGAAPQPEPQANDQPMPPPGGTTEAQVHAMADTLARTLFQQILFGAGPPPPAAPNAANANADANARPVPPGPIPFNIPMPGMPQQPQGEKKQWTPPPPPGATLRERVERKEREMGLRCSDISCGLGPTDEDPTPVVDPRKVRQIQLRPLPGHDMEGKTAACEHSFHPACLVSAERVAGWSGADQKREVEGEDDVEVSCPVCRAVGLITRADWDEGACALA